MKPTIRSVSDLRLMMHRNERPIYFVSATNFNLLGVDDWVRNFRFVSYIDCFDGRHPNVFVPPGLPHKEFRSIEDINNYLLQHKQVMEHILRRGGRPVATFLMFDETTEAICRDLGIEIWFPPARLRARCDNKIETVRIGDRAGVPSVPNVLAEIGSYRALCEAASKARLGDDLVVQTAFGDSGHTTFFISDEADFSRHAGDIVGGGEVKIMRRIACRAATLEACVTRSGTLVGPLLTEVIGQSELTPYRGGWCGNEIYPDAFSEPIRRKAQSLAKAFGDGLVKEGYRGYFDLDFLIDQENDEVYLGELNPRVCGASSITNHIGSAYADAPLWLFHLLEFSGADYEIDVDGLNERWAREDLDDAWSQLVIKSTGDDVEIIDAAPQTGIYRLDNDGRVAFDRFDWRRQAIDSDREAFFLRISGASDYRYRGADLGILITRGRATTGNGRLNERASRWVTGVKDAYRSRHPRGPELSVPLSEQPFKIL